MQRLRVLLLSDTHVGFDMPARPRIQRRRRGPDFVANFHRAVEPAIRGEADLVVHGGDLLYRSRVPPELVQLAMEPLMRAANESVPVFLVPGNHERSRVPFPLLTHHPLVHIFHQPRTVSIDVRGINVAVGGWPYHADVRAQFNALIRSTGLLETCADVRLLCVHQAVEGARVAAHDYMFRKGRDVIRCSDLPDMIAAVLSGHIHRAQVLNLPVPVVFSGSVERTAMAERLEPKGYMELSIKPDDAGGDLVGWRFVELPTRPMAVLDLQRLGSEESVMGEIQMQLGRLDPSAVVQVRVDPSLHVSIGKVRRLAPSTTNVELSYPSIRKYGRTGTGTAR